MNLALVRIIEFIKEEFKLESYLIYSPSNFVYNLLTLDAQIKHFEFKRFATSLCSEDRQDIHCTLNLDTVSITTS